MQNDVNICPICGEPTNSYMGKYRKDGLCKKHALMFKNGEIVSDFRGGYIDNNGELLSRESKETKAHILTRNNYEKCIVCDQDSNGKPLCKDCYYECKEMEDEIDRNKKPFELKDYYFNLKSANSRVVKKETVINNVKKMYALANICMDSYDDTSLIVRVNDDAKDIIEYINRKKEVKETNYTEQADSQKSSFIRTNDGHLVKSEGEKTIDNILYSNQLAHCYEKEVVEISSSERCVKSDFFVPFAGTKGVYIEYWGMTTREYLKNKDEKKKMYKENDIPLIEIEKDDVKESTGLETRILREIKKFKEEFKKSM